MSMKQNVMSHTMTTHNKFRINKIQWDPTQDQVCQVVLHFRMPRTEKFETVMAKCETTTPKRGWYPGFKAK